MQSIIEASKDDSGNPNPYKAVGIVAGTGNFSFENQMLLGGMLGSQGEFYDDEWH